MIALQSPSPRALEALGAAPGAFFWWYADARDAQGDGVVVIAAFGLPFLPGSRLGSSPRQRPSLNVVVYRAGRPACYVLQTYPPGAGNVELGPGGSVEIALGRSRLTLRSDDRRSSLQATLDLDLPDSDETLAGELRFDGPAVSIEATDDVPGHVWCPRSLFAHCQGRLTAGPTVFEFDAPGYVDSNFSRVPLHQQGIRAWSWGRVWLGESTLGYYVVEPEGAGEEPQVFLVEQGDDGKLELLNGEARATRHERGRYGLRSPRRFEIASSRGALVVLAERVVDDGPFYQRFFLELQSGSGRSGHGIGEYVMPSRVDVPWQRPFVRMRTHATHGPNSPFLPLFSGRSDGRLGRLLGSFVGGRS